MKQSERMLLCAVAGVALCLTARAIPSDSAGNPYQSIVERNVFGLKPPPPPPDPEAAKPPPQKIFLQGITTFGNVKRVLFKMQVAPAPGAQSKGEQSFVLAEGQREGDVEILEINAEAGTVKVNNSGTITNLNFENNGIKVATAPGPAPGAPPGFVPPPGGNPPAPAGSVPPFARPMRVPTPTGAAASPASTGTTPAYTSGGTGYGGQTASLALGGATSASAARTTTSAASTMTAEQQFLMVEAHRARLKQQGLENKFPPIPPTPLTRELNPDAATPAAQ